MILEAIKRLHRKPNLRKKFRYIGVKDASQIKRSRMKWQQNLKRVASCDILIDACNMTQELKRFGGEQ